MYGIQDMGEKDAKANLRQDINDNLKRDSDARQRIHNTRPYLTREQKHMSILVLVLAL